LFVDEYKKPKTKLLVKNKKTFSSDVLMVTMVEVATTLDTTIVEVPWDANVFARTVMYYYTFSYLICWTLRMM